MILEVGIFFFLLANTQKTYIRKESLKAGPKAYKEYTRGAQGHKKKRKYNTSPHLAPSQSKKLSKERGPSFTTDLVHTQRLQTKKIFNLFIESSSLSKAILREISKRKTACAVTGEGRLICYAFGRSLSMVRLLSTLALAFCGKWTQN